MKQDEIIAMAREAGMRANTGSVVDGEHHPAINALSASVPVQWLERFAALVAAREREACANVAADTFFGNAGEVNHEIAAAIRARGQV